MEAKDWINLLAILFSPVIAVLVTMWLQDRREKRARMYFVLATVVANRHQKLDATVIQALNSIDIIFSDNKDVRRLWEEYMEITELDFSNSSNVKKLDDKYVELIYAMANVLGYRGKVSQIQMGRVYFPAGLGNQFMQSQELLSEALKVFKGEKPLVVAAYASEPEPQDSTSGSGNH